MKCVQLADIQPFSLNNRRVPEVADHAAGVIRRVLLSEHVLPASVRLSHALIAPGQSVAKHRHERLLEVFYILDGKGVLTVEAASVAIEAGCCFVIEPGELHALVNDGSIDLTMIYFALPADA